ncbi:hypothetical protein M422DRAFT_52222 [Sphaerobolus stellatus SS14]|uniref:DUF6533 domain-containing protein n=1 Tax=Sphaerobolus stellatus (strain SS14) TaxID=990650 RepID=A0A0C9V9E8_SPHS4|nr:hypothetical protein M422DRAFT_52222 [Sphaerobolus stellatus SS14]
MLEHVLFALLHTLFFTGGSGSVAGIVVCIFEWVIAIPDELKYVWKGRISTVSALYIILRYTLLIQAGLYAKYCLSIQNPFVKLLEQLWLVLSRIVGSTSLPNPSLNTTMPSNTTLSSEWLPFLNDTSRATPLNVTSLPEPIKQILQDLKPIRTPAEIILVNVASYMNIMGVAGILFIRALSLSTGKKKLIYPLGLLLLVIAALGMALLIQVSAKTRNLKRIPIVGHFALGLSNVYSRHFWYHNLSNSGTGYTRKTTDCISTDTYKCNTQTGNDLYWRMRSRTLLVLEIAGGVVATQLSRYRELGEYETVMSTHP